MSSESMEQPAKHAAQAKGYSKENFLGKSMEPEHGQDRFQIEHLLVRIEVDGFVWIRRGSVIAYRGDLKFHRESVLQAERFHLLSGPIGSAVEREIVPLAKAEGKGCLYVSDNGMHNQVVRLEGGSVYIASPNLLAFEPTLEHEVRMLGGVGVLAGGIFMIKISGNGLVAFSLKGEPMTMRVTPDNPVSTDPTATIAWTGDLWPELKTDIEMSSLVMHGGGEPIQMLFRGDGYVVVNGKSQLEATRGSLIKRMTSKIAKLVGF